jgi:hypothetical protein
MKIVVQTKDFALVHFFSKYTLRNIAKDFKKIKKNLFVSKKVVPLTPKFI